VWAFLDHSSVQNKFDIIYQVSMIIINMDNHTLEFILTLDSSSLGKISSTCKHWYSSVGEYRDQEKMSYLKESSLMIQDSLIQQLEFEMYRCGTAHHDTGFYYSWREYTDDWEDDWYGYRDYSFFYKDYMDKNHPHIHHNNWYLPLPDM